ncbi:MAG: hypothetical protein RIR96_441 [Bacteroidota bacterium]|jgi:hypothetical protein
MTGKRDVAFFTKMQHGIDLWRVTSPDPSRKNDFF